MIQNFLVTPLCKIRDLLPSSLLKPEIGHISDLKLILKATTGWNSFESRLGHFGGTCGRSCRAKFL